MDAKTSSRSDLFGRPDFESDESVIFYPIYTVYVSSKHPTCEFSIDEDAFKRYQSIYKKTTDMLESVDLTYSPQQPKQPDPPKSTSGHKSGEQSAKLVTSMFSS